MSIDRKMAEHAVKSLILTRLELHYRARHRPTLSDGSTPNPAYEALVRDYIKQLSVFETKHIERGMDEFVASWDKDRWPNIGELRAYFVAEQRLETKEAPRLEPPEPEVRVSPDEREIVRRQMSVLKEMIKSGDIVRMSLDEGLAYCKARARDPAYRPREAAESPSAVRREVERRESIERTQAADEVVF